MCFGAYMSSAASSCYTKLIAESPVIQIPPMFSENVNPPQSAQLAVNRKPEHGSLRRPACDSRVCHMGVFEN